MTRSATIGVGIIAVLLAASTWAIVRPAPAATPSPTATDVYARGLRRLDVALVALDAAMARGDRVASLATFRNARREYKRVELFVEYYGGGLARELNGVTIPKAEDEDPETPLAPVGLQVIEAALFPDGDSAHIVAARQYVPYMRLAVRALAQAGVDTMPGDAYVFDAMRQELARIASLGVAGFDATLSGDAMRESADAIDGVRHVLAVYASRPGGLAPGARADSALAATGRALRATLDSAGPDRLELIARGLVPSAHRLLELQRALAIGPAPKPRAWSGRSASAFDRHAFDVAFFAATDAPPPTEALVSLGRELFFDSALSGTGTRACATCHRPERAFTDGRALADLIPGHRHARRARNTPTLINAAVQPSLFADSRVRTLEDQATDVIGSASEMGGSLAAAGLALAKRDAYRSRFEAAVGAPVDSARAARAIRLSLAAYIRSLVRLDSRFDRAVRGDAHALTPEERRGFDLFMGRAACGTCHFAPLFGGAMPPTFIENEPEVIGVPSEPVRRGARIDPDSGRFNVRPIAQHLHAFKTPSLRNVALTAPYMHNGVYRTLTDVLDFYDAGGGHGIGAALPHQTLPADSLHLTAPEKRAIIAFLGALTDTSRTTARPPRRQ